MPVINQQVEAAARRNFRAIFYNSLSQGRNNDWWRQLFMVIQSSNPTETFYMLRGQPEMREWLGDRQARKLAEVSFTIEKKEWEASITVLRDNILYDRLNMVRPAIQSLANAYPEHLKDYAVTLMLGGFTSDAYDGQYFFDTDHDNGSGTTFSNKSTAVFSAAEWVNVRTRPASLKDAETGRYMNVRYTHAFYGVDSEAAFESVFGIRQSGAGVDNIYFNAIPPERRHVIPELGATGKWFFFDLSKPIKPFILMINKGLEFTALDSAKDWNVFNRKEYIYGVDSIDNASYGLWEVAFGSTNGE